MEISNYFPEWQKNWKISTVLDITIRNLKKKIFITFFFILGHRVPDNSGLGEAIAMTTFDQKNDDNKSDVDQDENETSLDP